MEKKDKTNKNNRCHRAGWSFAEAFYQISQISDNPRNAMRHCAEAIFTGPRSGLDINDIWALLEHNGVLETFEVSVNANEENRMEQLVEQIRMHLDRCGHLTCILLIFYPAQDNPVTMDEIKELGLDPVDSFAVFFGQMFGLFDEDEDSKEEGDEDAGTD